jgi:hypothetical protein
MEAANHFARPPRQFVSSRLPRQCFRFHFRRELHFEGPDDLLDRLCNRFRKTFDVDALHDATPIRVAYRLLIITGPGDLFLGSPAFAIPLPRRQGTRRFTPPRRAPARILRTPRNRSQNSAGVAVPERSCRSAREKASRARPVPPPAVAGFAPLYMGPRRAPRMSDSFFLTVSTTKRATARTPGETRASRR